MLFRSLDGPSGSLLQKINDTSSTVTDIFGSSVTFVGMVIPDDNIQTGIEPNAGNMTNSNNIPIQAENANGLEIINLQVQPSTFKVGDTFTINATLVNNSTNPIFAEHGACEASFFVTFDNHVTANVKNKICHLELIAQKLNPGEKITGTSPPSSNLTYRAIAAGTANATVTFSYEVWDQTTQSSIRKVISKSVLFTIHENNTGTKAVKDASSSPLKQFKSGIAAEDIACKDDFELVIKIHNHLPACVKPITMTKLMERDWIILPKSVVTENTNILIRYAIDGGKILSVNAYGAPPIKNYNEGPGRIGPNPTNGLFVFILNLQTTKDGKLAITIPQEITGSIRGERSLVLLDGEEIDYNEIISHTTRTLLINFTNGISEIQIIGSGYYKDLPIFPSASPQ